MYKSWLLLKTDSFTILWLESKINIFECVSSIWNRYSNTQPSILNVTPQIFIFTSTFTKKKHFTFTAFSVFKVTSYTGWIWETAASMPFHVCLGSGGQDFWKVCRPGWALHVVVSTISFSFHFYCISTVEPVTEGWGFLSMTS